MISAVKKRYLEYLGVSWEFGRFGEELCADILDAGLNLPHNFDFMSRLLSFTSWVFISCLNFLF